MILKVLATGSKGNCYILESSIGEMLIIECGITIGKIMSGIKFNPDKVSGCLLSHEDTDHSYSVKQMLDRGFKVYSSKGTFEEKNVFAHHNAISMIALKEYSIGSFSVIPFDVKHDAADPYGFLIKHEEMGKTLFLTDTYLCEYSFPGLNNIIIEANYDDEKMDSTLLTKPYLRDRIIQAHMSIENTVNYLQQLDLSLVNNIILIHLSDSNSNENKFVSMISSALGKKVVAANNGTVIDDFNQHPFYEFK